MEQKGKVVTWEGFDRDHIEKGSDWYWALSIISFCGAIAAFFFGNFLFAILIIVGSVAVALQSYKRPKIVPFMVGTRGVRVGEKLFPYSTLDSYRIDEEDERGPLLLLKSKKLYMPLIIMSIPEDAVHEIESLVRDRLKEEDLREPFSHKLLEYLGF